MPVIAQLAPLLALSDATIFTGEAMVDGHALLIHAGKIIDIVAQNKIPTTAVIESWSQHILAPGFIDVQVNGGGNVLFNSDPTVQACVTIAKAHQKYGTTRILPTFITEEPSVTSHAIEAARKACHQCPNILGIHIEGPHISTEKRGVHKDQYVRPLSIEDINQYKRHTDEIVLITVAPENVTPQQIRDLCKVGVFVSLGHSNATTEQVYEALVAGATGFTHLFNGMGGISARAPGMIGVALDDQASWCGLIVDGYHISPEMVRLAVKAKAVGKMILVSDAMSPAATDTPRPFELYGETIIVEDGRCINNEGRLAGAAITLSDAVKNCVQLGIDVEESLRMASSYPAAFLGLENKLGKLLPGYAADIVALDYDFIPQKTWVAGQPE